MSKGSQQVKAVAGDKAGARTVSVEEAGRQLGLCRASAYARAKDGSLPTIKMGKRLLVPTAALEKMLSVGAA